MSHCDARVPVEVKNFQSQKIFQLFFKTCLLHVSGIWDNFKRKNFFRLSDQSESRYRNDSMRSQRQKLSLTCNQRRRALPVRITWKGDWTSGLIALRCESARRQSRSKIFEVKKCFLVPVQLEFRSVLKHSVLGQDVSGAGRRGAESLGAGGQWGRTSWGRTSWGRTSLGQYPWGRTSWGRRLVGQDIVGQKFVGQDVAGAISLGQEVSGAGGSGAGSRESIFS